MRFQNSGFIFIVSIALCLTGCFSDEPTENSNIESNAPNQNTNISDVNNSNTKNPLETTVANTAPKELNEAVTLKPIVDAYCAAINSGDDAALKNIYSKASWNALSADSRSEGQKSVAKYLGDSEPTGGKCRVVNEKMSGDVAEAIVITQTYPKGVPLKFVKEDGNWKMTNQSSDFDAVRQSSK